MNRNEIINLARKLKSNETTEIPHDEMMKAMYQHYPEDVHRAFLYSEACEFAEGIANICNVTIKFRDSSNTWVIRRKP